MDQPSKHSRTAQECPEATKRSTARLFGFPQHGSGIKYYSPQQIGWLADEAIKTIISIPHFDDVDDKHESSDEYKQNWAHIQDTHPAVIMSSSGSAGLPTLIHKTHRELITGIGNIPSPVRKLRYFVGSWMHYIGGLLCLFFAFVKDPEGPAVWPLETTSFHPDDYRKVLAEAKPDVAWVNPVVLREISSTDEGLRILQSCKAVVAAGLVCPQYLGNKLVAAGVRLSNEYGMTELAAGLSSIPGDPDWEYLQPDALSKPHVGFRLLPEAEGSSSFSNGEDGTFHPDDMFVKYPTEPRYKWIGRASDELKILLGHHLVLISAVEYENRIMAKNDDILQDTVLFGNNRPYPGVLLFEKPECAMSAENVAKRVWSTVEEDLKGQVPVDLKQNMMVFVPGYVVPRTGKGSFIRPLVYHRNEDVKNKAYDDAGAPNDNTCDKTHGSGQSYGPVNTQAGSGLNDGIYSHQGADQGIRASIYGLANSSSTFARLGAPFGNHDILMIADDASPGRNYWAYKNNGNGGFAEDATKFTLSDGCIARGVRWVYVNEFYVNKLSLAGGLDDMICISPNGDTYVTLNKGSYTFASGGLWKKSEGPHRIASFFQILMEMDGRIIALSAILVTYHVGAMEAKGRDDWMWVDDTGRVNAVDGVGYKHYCMSKDVGRQYIQFAKVYGQPEAFALGGRADYVWIEDGGEVIVPGLHKCNFHIWQNEGSGTTKLKDYVWAHSTGYMVLYESFGGTFPATPPFWDLHYQIWTSNDFFGFQADRRDLRLAGWDGVGLCDIIYVVHNTGSSIVWFNQFK
ncbi:hypothetical protein GQ53DRAFT_863585 [Thozetella sp. PMI_491]|nr:hypothetical protein GQ53DRAFT_863585 [Thozetella sp. PMI_491]